MPDSSLFTYMSTILQIIAQSMMIPVMVGLVLMILFALFIIGSMIVEIFTENRHFKVNSPKIINEIHESKYEELENVIRKGRLLRPQRNALITVVKNMGLNDDELYALAKMQIEKVNDRYKKILSQSEIVTKVAPMFGLMSTLIPLGPGIVAMGQGNVVELSMSLLVAFNGTVAGLIAAVVTMIVTSIRKRWYAKYIVILEALMTAILNKAETVKAEGVDLPVVSKKIVDLPENRKGEKV